MTALLIYSIMALDQYIFLLLFNNNHSSSQPHSAKANLLRCQEEKVILFNMQFI